MTQTEKEILKCPKCGSRDLFKTRVSQGINSGSETATTSPQYKCSICGHHFHQSLPE